MFSRFSIRIGRSPRRCRAFDPHFRATLRFHDAIEPGPGVVLPQKPDVDAILAFGRDAGGVRHLLIHCHAGISRSTAAMLMILAQAYPRETEGAIVDRLLEIRPQAWPNSRMVAFADELLGRDGRLTLRSPHLRRAARDRARPRGNDAPAEPGEGGRARPDDVSVSGWIGPTPASLPSKSPRAHARRRRVGDSGGCRETSWR